MEIWLSNGTKDKIQIPVNPQSLGYSDSSNFEDVILANGDERTIISGRNLREYSIESFFPRRRATYVTSKKLLLPIEYVRKIKVWMDTKKVLQLQVTKTNINVRVTIRSFEWNEEGGAVGDINYVLELKEYKPVVWKTTSSSPSGSKPKPPSKRPPSASSGQRPSTYTVKKNDNLFNIAKKYLGSSSRWPEIYKLNRKVIGSNPNRIYPGQRLVLPK